MKQNLDEIKATVIKWNTGRAYTAEGQRCAAVAIGKGVLLVDHDRMIEYYIPDCGLTQKEIMARYDNNDRTEYRPESMPIEDFIALRNWLEEQAKLPVGKNVNPSGRAPLSWHLCR